MNLLLVCLIYKINSTSLLIVNTLISIVCFRFQSFPLPKFKCLLVDLVRTSVMKYNQHLIICYGRLYLQG